MSLPRGTRIGPYEILDRVGEGGMGTVYRARDPRLDRIVALKIPGEAFTAGVQREAQAVAALNDPHVAQIYDVGPDYLVMEFVDGAPLVPTADPAALLSHAGQITDGLIAAHAAGIVHRDLKPGNILLSRSGRLKILDFGLASRPTSAAAGEDPTAATYAGSMAGTLAYMSPEQARGEPLDARSDLWSLGAVLYELATGVRPFSGSTPALILDGILNRSPVPVRDLQPRVPTGLALIIERLLEKDRDHRYQTAADVRAELRRLERDSTPGRSPEFRRSHASAWIAALAAVVVVSTAAFFVLKSPRAPAPVTNPAQYVQLTHFTDSATAPALSADGRMVAFIRGGGWFLSSGQIFLKLLPSGEAVQLTTSSSPKLGPAFTPDGSRVAYTLVDRDGNPPSWDTWTVPIHGGASTRLMANAAALTWLDQRRVLFSEMRPRSLHMGIVTSTESRTERGEIYFPNHERAMAHYSWPSPDRRWLLIVEMNRMTEWDRCRLIPFDGGAEVRLVGPNGPCIAAAWSPDGQWMYFSAAVDGAFHLWRQRFPDGVPEQITFGPNEEEGVAVSPDGTWIVSSIGIRQRSVWIHDDSGERAVTSEGFTFAPLISRDGSLVYFLSQDTASSPAELRSHDLTTGMTKRLLPGLAMGDYDVSADHREVAYTTTTDDGGSEVWLATLDQRTPPRRLLAGADSPVFIAEGELVVRVIGETSNWMERVRRDGSGRRRLGEDSVMDTLRTSPDGEWILALVKRGDIPVTVALPLRGGEPVPLCRFFCFASWSADGRYFFVQIQSELGDAGGMARTAGRTLAVPVAPGSALPTVPPNGFPLGSDWTGPPGTRVIDQSAVAAGSAPDRYAFTRTDVQRNLYRIPLLRNK